MKKSFKVLVGSLFMLLVLTGCGNKKMITIDTFKSKMESHSYTINDVMDKYSDLDYVKEAYTASKEEDYEVGFYVLAANDDASDLFGINKESLEKNKNSLSEVKEKNGKNYETYIIKNNGFYIYLSRVDNTLLFISFPENSKKEADEIAKELGY